MKRILIATDLSARSDRALLRAVMLAEKFGAQLKVLHVVDSTLHGTLALQHEAAAKEAIAEQISALQEQPTHIIQEVVQGCGYADIAQRAADFEADLIVLGIHRHGSRELFRGTTSERVLRYGTLPVLVVKDAPLGPYKRVMVAADLSAASHAALKLAARLAPMGEVYLLHAAHRPFTVFLGRETQNQLIAGERARIAGELEKVTEQVTRELGSAAPRFETLLREGEVRRVIRDHVTALKPNLVAVGTHGRTGLAHAIIGSVAEDLLSDAPVDVLAVKSD